MDNMDMQQIEKLLDEKKFEEAKKALRQYFDSELTDIEEGEIYVQAMTDYLTMSNRINQLYLDEMRALQKQLAETDEMRSELNEEIDKDQIREDIQNM